VTCSCGDPSRPHINHRKTIPCWTYVGDNRVTIDRDGHVVRDCHHHRQRLQRGRRLCKDCGEDLGAAPTDVHSLEGNPFEVDMVVTHHGAHGVIRQRKQDQTDPVHWRYEIRWETGTFGWWGHAKVAEMNPQR
jgi:hypothetical protein